MALPPAEPIAATLNQPTTTKPMTTAEQGPMELQVLARYLARAHNNDCQRSAEWGWKVGTANLEAWNWCQAYMAGQTTARPSWLARQAITRVIGHCSLDFT